MNEPSDDAVNLNILEPESNRGYLPQPIPASRDDEIVALLSQVIAENHLARFARQLMEKHAIVLRVFAERAATAAVRNDDPSLLRLAVIGLILSWRGSDCRETLVIFPVLYDAIRRMGIEVRPFAASIQQTVGDQLASPLMEFLKRSERDKSLQAMGYTAGTDHDGFRYVRNW